jgi:putative transcriptional regulator
MIDRMHRPAHRLLHLIAPVLMLLPLAAPSQQIAPAVGRFLVSAPELSDATFSRTVILLIHHDENGSIGLFINRPTNLRPAAIFGDQPGFAGYKGSVFFGGPVSPQQPVMLLRDPPAAGDGDVRVLEGVYVNGDPGALARVAESARSPDRVRIYAGRAEWSPGQLEDEIARGTWSVVGGQASLVFAEESDDLWSRALLLESGDIVRL